MFAEMNWIKNLSYEDTRIVSEFEQIYSGQYWRIDFFDGKVLLVYSYGKQKINYYK